MNKIIYVIDDDQVILDGIQSILEEEGYKVITSSDSATFVSKIKEQRPDLILMDYLLEGDTGVNLTRTLKSADDTRNVPIIMISGDTMTKDLAKKAGADDYIEKPFQIDYLLEKVHKYAND